MRPLIWIGHVTLKVRSIEESEPFYTGLGLRSVFKNDAVLIVELRGGTHLILAEDNAAVPGDADFDFMVEDIEGALSTFSEQGLVVSEMTEGDIHKSFYLSDPTGNRILFNSTHVEDHSLV